MFVDGAGVQEAGCRAGVSAQSCCCCCSHGIRGATTAALWSERKGRVGKEGAQEGGGGERETWLGLSGTANSDNMRACVTLHRRGVRAWIPEVKRPHRLEPREANLGASRPGLSVKATLIWSFLARSK